LLLSFDVDVGLADVVAFELDLLVVLTDNKVLSELLELDLLVVDVFNEVFEPVLLAVDKVLSELFELDLLVVDVFNEVFELVLLVAQLVLVLVATGAVKSSLSITNNSLL
jgi:hypothetical protein